LENSQNGNLPLKPSELISDAEVRTSTKGEVWIFRPFQVDMVGIFELTPIAIGRNSHSRPNDVW